MEKYYWVQIKESPNVGLAGKHLDIRFHVPGGLTGEQIKLLGEEINSVMNKYGEKHGGDYADMDYYKILESAMKKLAVNFEYPKVDYTLNI